jgi:hypothetical protein
VAFYIPQLLPFLCSARFLGTGLSLIGTILRINFISSFIFPHPLSYLPPQAWLQSNDAGATLLKVLLVVHGRYFDGARAMLSNITSV